ncbi:tryptophan-rich sensory protein [Actinotalea caeni]|uniref:tryptophan-rich sensory protein n=1 Tax=Actinotalea caeni TaxID=1348467 RepID=UPI0012E28451|nr:tryptophan-rich sensory protein [Actinotalea caeni]
MTTVTSRDRLRQIVVTVSEVACLAGTLVGTGLIGTRVEESAGGALSDEATPLAPAGPAFSIWSVIYLGLLAYTVWQWFPANAATERTRRTGWLVAVSMLLNATWLLVTQQGWIWPSVVVIAVLMVVLGVALVRLSEHPARTPLERVVVDGTVGLYTGWVAVATCANTAAALAASGVEIDGVAADVLGVAVLAAAVVVAALLARRAGGRIALALAMVWGLVWIAVGRLADEPSSTVIGLAAIVAALAVVAIVLLRRRQPGGVPATA